MRECPTCGNSTVYHFKDVTVLSVSRTTGVFLIAGYGSVRFAAQWDYLRHVCPRYSVPCRVGATGPLALSDDWLHANSVSGDEDPKHPASLGGGDYRTLKLQDRPGAEWVRVAPLLAEHSLSYAAGGVRADGQFANNPVPAASPIYEMPAELVTGYHLENDGRKVAPDHDFGIRFGVTIPGLWPYDHDEAVVARMRKYPKTIGIYETRIDKLDGMAERLDAADLELLARSELVVLERLYDVALLRYAAEQLPEETFNLRVSTHRRDHVSPSAGLHGALDTQRTGFLLAMLDHIGF